jgi:hypothetical protein
MAAVSKKAWQENVTFKQHRWYPFGSMLGYNTQFMEVLFTDDNEVDFGGQNQIVNQQEQNREVNPGGLTQTDSEKSLYGPKAEETEPTDKSRENEKEKDSEKEEDNKEEIEAPARKLIETVV